MRTLHQQIKNLKIPILIDNIKSITVDQNNVSFANEKQYKARNVFIPSYCDVQKVKSWIKLLIWNAIIKIANIL